MSRWHPCSTIGCDQLAHDHDQCDDCREAAGRERRRPTIPKQRSDDDTEG